MPIKASADKLAREFQQFGDPPNFPHESEEEIDTVQEAEEANADAPPDKFKGKKSKAASKSGGQKFQWEIMRSFGLSDNEISKFQNPYNWLTYFPPLAKEDLIAFGLAFDVMNKVKKIAGGMRWNTKLMDHEDGPLVPEKILVAVKQYWVGSSGNSTSRDE
uniref:Uncharacterized protein n=1 Tax=Quercus lobata TaxID=97700 RepID=A0A7N2REA5_QUELO